MTPADTEETTPPAQDAFRLRGSPPPVVRLSRKGLAVLGAIGAAAVGAALTFALTPRLHVPAPQDPPPASDTRPPAEVVTAAPKDYAAAPRLGPSLPGDLGRPIVAAQARDGVPVPTPAAASTAHAPTQPSPAAQARQTALTSAILADVGRGSASPAATAARDQALDPTPEAMIASATLTATPAPAPAQASAKLTAMSSPYTLLAGSVIPAALITGLNSDLPGQAIAQVTADVHDTVTGRIRLIPAGARLIGAYDAQVTFGQRRIHVTWTRLVLPDGASIALTRQTASDPQGFAGLTDQVDSHWGAIARAAGLSTLLGVGAELGADDEGDIARALRRGMQDTINQAGQQIVRRQLDVRPTLTVRPGHPVRLILSEDLVLDPVAKESTP